VVALDDGIEVGAGPRLKRSSRSRFSSLAARKARAASMSIPKSVCILELWAQGGAEDKRPGAADMQAKTVFEGAGL